MLGLNNDLIKKSSCKKTRRGFETYWKSFMDVYGDEVSRVMGS